MFHNSRFRRTAALGVAAAALALTGIAVPASAGTLTGPADAQNRAASSGTTTGNCEALNDARYWTCYEDQSQIRIASYADFMRPGATVTIPAPATCPPEAANVTEGEEGSYNIYNEMNRVARGTEAIAFPTHIGLDVHVGGHSGQASGFSATNYTSIFDPISKDRAISYIVHCVKK